MSESREFGSTDQAIAEQLADDWGNVASEMFAVGLPFRIHPTFPNVRHIIDKYNQEYLVVKSEREPYDPLDVFINAKSDYKLEESAESRFVHVFNLTDKDIITLPAIMNDAISAEGKPKLVIRAFKAIGYMLHDLNQSSLELRGEPITPGVQLEDIAFIKGEREPILLPPFNLDAGNDLSEVVSDLSYEMSRTPLSENHRKIARQALVAFEAQLA